MNHYAVTGKQMRAIEQAAFDQGVPPILVMEYAARAVYQELEKRLHPLQGKHVLFLCGCGNNGGDGLAAARYFHQAGGRSVVYMPKEAGTQSAREQLAFAQYLGIPILSELPQSQDYDALVDALLGTGLSRAPEGCMKDAIEWINDAHLPVISVDIPSGMDADTGSVPGPCVRADVTVTFHAAKLGLYMTQHMPLTGTIQVADIGLYQDQTGIPYYLPKDLNALLPPRPVNAHKGSCGRILIYAGSEGKAGAAAMCALGALKAGAGLVTIACERDILPVLQMLLPNAMCVPVEDAPDCNFDMLAAGCGIGQSKHASKHLIKLCQKAQRAVLDADALNLLAEAPFQLPETTVLTPHPLEGARLLGISLGDALSAPLDTARAIADKYHCTVIFKNAVSVVADKKKLALNIAGSPALAKGGSGDALCGILAATMCEWSDPFESSRIACLRMGCAAIEAAKIHGERGMLTSEMLQHLK